MLSLHFVVLAGASLLLLQVGTAVRQGDRLEETGENTTEHTASRVDCLPAINAARTKAGLPAFSAPKEAGSKLPIVDSLASGSTPVQKSTRTQNDESQSSPPTDAQTAHATLLNAFCASLPKDDNATKGQNDTNGTYMYAPANSKEVEECSTAVDYWKSAVTSFSTLPPPYTQGKDPYDKHKNISFVGLFNTGINTTVDCAAITCNLEKDEDPELKNDEFSSRQDQKAAVYSLLCLSSPPALQVSEKPFTQAQWGKITGAESSSAYLGLFGVLAIAATAFMHSLF